MFISETDLDVKLELKTVMDKIRTLSMGKNKETVVSLCELVLATGLAVVLLPQILPVLATIECLIDYRTC